MSIPKTPLSSAYMTEFHRQMKIYRPQIIQEQGLAQDATMVDIFNDSMVIAMHRVSWLWALRESGAHFRGRNARRNAGALQAELDDEIFEWCQLAYAAQTTTRSQVRLWNKICQERNRNQTTPLERIALGLREKGINNPPYTCYVGEGGGLYILNP